MQRPTAALAGMVGVLKVLTLCLPKTTAKYPNGAPAWHCGVPTDPGRWHEAVTPEGGVAIEAQYTAAELALMLALCPQVPVAVAVRAMELVGRGRDENSTA